MLLTGLFQILKFIDLLTWLDFNLIDWMDNWTIEKKNQTIKVTHKAARFAGICFVTFQSNKHYQLVISLVQTKTIVFKKEFHRY